MRVLMNEPRTFLIGDLMTFKPGDLVEMKLGGPVMTVEKVGKLAMTEEEAVWCNWFERVGNRQVVQKDAFSPDVLKHADPSPGASMRLVRG